jgi:hypothetical protein
VGYSRDVFGYWPLEMHIRQGGYEVNGFKQWFGVPYEWRTGVDQVFSNLVSSSDHAEGATGRSDLAVQPAHIPD